MHQQNDSDKNQMEIIKPNQNRMAAASVNVETQLPVFEMNADCWDELFHFLSIKDVHLLFGQTCKTFQQVVQSNFGIDSSLGAVKKHSNPSLLR